MTLFTLAAEYFETLQKIICSELEAIDTNSKFCTDAWQKVEGKPEQGGGISRVFANGKIFEKAGVNTSNVQGILKSNMALHLTGSNEEQEFSACGISLVIHPLSPMVPTTHANLRFIQVGNKCWFGGGMDLTPYYVFEEDAIHFHQVLKDCCDFYTADAYTKYKKECDQYFYLPHRKEHRGIGGIFFDYIGRDEQVNYDHLFNFVKKLGDNWLNMYVPIVKKRMLMSYTEEQRKFQLIRRGRYVEFNLLYDRGTKFGLETGGRTESILMSLPNIVNWDYCPNYESNENSPEFKLVHTLKNPKDWLK